MACQTGIRADDKLIEFFEQCKKCKVRMGKVVINNEKMSVNFQHKPSNDWRNDWKKCLPDKIDSYEPCFLLFRFESTHDWILITFADDKASTKDKMLLAATKATFKSDFGQSFIKAEFHISNRNDLVLDSFEKRYLVDRIAKPAVTDDEIKPLSFVERELASVAKERAGNPFTASQTLKGVQFPIDQNATERIKDFILETIDFVQLSIDILNEAIKLEESRKTVDPDGISSLIPKQRPRYSLFRLKNVVFFIYSIPPSQSCTIKELMLYSSCKSPFLGEIQNELGLKIDKKIEIDSRERIDDRALLSYLGEQQITGAMKFEKPQRPGRNAANSLKTQA